MVSSVPGAALAGRHVAHADADVEQRRVRARGDVAAAGDGHALPRDRLLLHHERDEPPRRARRLDAPQLVGAGELLVERARPAEPGRDRIRLLRDVVAVQRVADLEPEGVASAEPAGTGTAGDDCVPQRDRVLGGAEQLDAALTGVAGAADHHLDAVDLAHGVA